MNLRYKIEIATFRHPLVKVEDFTIESGKITFLFGESGIGKTLLAQTIFGLVSPRNLRIIINGQTYFQYLQSQRLKILQQNGFYVFQEPSTHLNPLMTLEEQLNEGSLATSEDDRDILESLWAAPFETHIRPLLRIYPKPFRPSGGEKQRLLLAMALKKMDALPKEAEGLFILDEPTGSLDNYFRNLFLKELFKRFREKRPAILFITHDYSIISEIEKSHGDLKSFINLHELRRINDHQVKAFPFKSVDYLSWLKRQKPFESGSKKKRQVVLRIKGGFSVFGKTFVFYKAGGRRSVNLLVEREHITYLKAPSGLGKTTLAKIISGLQKAEKITFELAGISFDQETAPNVWRQKVWGKKLSMVFQHADEALNLNATVRQIFKGLPLAAEFTEEHLMTVLEEIFDQSLTESFLNKKVAFLSGGQKQRLNLLRALLLHPDLIILDEPLNGLDFMSIQRVLKLIAGKMVSGSGILLISHNEEIFDKIIPDEYIYYLKTANNQA
ncbi:ABC transporter related protein [Caldithrix abyssi DSM 13497]|uniref:ABC transporter related protein n=1 Tax=Caldithrix abyssi DSM 13497 TaxID=880073 RepID=H1XYU1_CALAY|nr:ATP-binding cassette domain-containing protein [Caldithrix abyssi]APF20522.1 ABC-type glutathione transport system ATPase component, contains duplicated ATPase domain [Caldithrix abyssi DSM 13497]EHO40960.1 ABC transporter related protein [Caldithrix abyssi DSM 13497]